MFAGVSGVCSRRWRIVTIMARLVSTSGLKMSVDVPVMRPFSKAYLTLLQNQSVSLTSLNGKILLKVAEIVCFPVTFSKV